MIRSQRSLYGTSLLGAGAVHHIKLWLRELNDDQIVEVGNRLQRLEPEIARAWTPDEVKDLVRNARLP